jgi:hypothetical protein
MYSAVQDKSANYTIVAADAGDLIRVSTGSGAVTITLPAISAVGDGFKIAVVKWTSDANAVNIARSGSDTINGATSAQIGSQYSQIILVADGETSTWFASQSGLGATNVNIDNFSGNGSTVAFTLTSDPSTENNTSVFISGVYQQKNTYSVSGTTLTFSTAPPSGTGNIEVAYATPLAIGTPSDGTVSTQKIVDGAVTAVKMGSDAPLGVSDKANTSTGFLSLPSGTTAQRPVSPANGYVRYNTTTTKVEAYQNGEWVNYSLSYAAEYVVIGGGGGGGVGNSGPNQEGGGGGGAGGYRSSVSGESSGGGSSAESVFSLISGSSYTVTVGGGGAGATSDTTNGSQGGSSAFATITSNGGGYGAAANSSGASGGSGGGGGANTSGSGGSGTSGQGYAGGTGATSAQSGGGGGAGAVGVNSGTYVTGGNGGNGVSSSITGTAVTRAGGGGGGSYNSGSGGSGGGGTGAGGSASGTAGATNTGSGGGGGKNSPYFAGNGGSGVVIIRYAGAQKGTGGTVTSSGGYTIHTFTSSGTFTA